MARPMEGREGEKEDFSWRPLAAALLAALLRGSPLRHATGYQSGKNPWPSLSLSLSRGFPCWHRLSPEERRERERWADRWRPSCFSAASERSD